MVSRINILCEMQLSFHKLSHVLNLFLNDWHYLCLQNMYSQIKCYTLLYLRLIDFLSIILSSAVISSFSYLKVETLP